MRRKSGFHGAEDVMSGIIKLKGVDLKTFSNKKGDVPGTRNSAIKKDEAMKFGLAVAFMGNNMDL